MNVLLKHILPCGLLLLAGCSSYPVSEANRHSVTPGQPNHTIQYIQDEGIDVSSQTRSGETLTLPLEAGEQTVVVQQRYFSAIGTTCFALLSVSSSTQSTQPPQYNLCEYPKGWGVVRAFRN